MTLQAAIERIIIERGRPLKSTEIANEINVRGLYTKADKTKISASQVIARVNKYPDIFNITEQGISLHEITLLPYRELSNKMLHLLRRMYSFNDESSTRDIVASFLLLIFNSEHNLKLGREPEKSKENLIKAFELFEEAEPEIRNRLSHVYQFLTGPISELEAEQIILLIRDFRFPLLKIPEQEEFSSFFNDFINAYSWKTNFRGGEFSTPKLVSKLMCSLYNLPEGATVFDPFAGRV